MNIAPDVVDSNAVVITAGLSEFDTCIAAALAASVRLKEMGLRFLERNDIPVGLAGEAFYYLGQAEAGLGEAAKGSQGLHASLHELRDRLKKKPTEERSGPKDKDPPPKP